MTKGWGVDVVLNSLAGPMLHASIRCMARHGRFLEIGKYDMAVDSKLGLAALARNISFHAIFLDQLMHDDDFAHPDWPIVYRMLADVRFLTNHSARREYKKRRVTAPLCVSVQSIVNACKVAGSC